MPPSLVQASCALERAALDEQMHARVDRPEQELNTAGVYAEINERLRGEESADITHIGDQKTKHGSVAGAPKNRQRILSVQPQ